MVSAAPNIGKSIFVQNMALELVCGGSTLLNRFSVAPAKVLYLDLEMGESALQERFKKMSAVRNGNLDNLFVRYIPALDILNEESRKLIENWLNELKVDVLILDPLGNAWSGDESKQESVGKLTAYLNTLIDRFDISLLVVHHWRKATKEAKTGGQMAAGSYKWAAWLDCHVTLEGEPHSVTISCHKNRNRPKFPPIITKINSDTLCFEFVGDYQKKFDGDTLQNLFDSFNVEKVSVPDLIKRAKEQKGPSETTLRNLIKKTTVFKTVPMGKIHYLVRKDSENLAWDEVIEP